MNETAGREAQTDQLPTSGEGTTATGDEGALVRRLREELRATRDEYQRTVERLVRSTDALKAASAERKTTDEELRSLNEELMMVNQQLQLKIVELENSNSYISSLLASSQIATICLDRDCRIQWFSPGMKTVGNIVPSDVGRPITDFSAHVLGSHLVNDAESVLATLTPHQREWRTPDDHWYLRRVVPYRSDGDGVDGVVVTYADITEAKQGALRADEALRSNAITLELENRVRERTAQLRKLTAELALTEERERRVLARDLHDGLGQLLAIAKIKLTSLEESERRGQLKGALKEIEDLVDQSNRSVRSLMLQLYPPALQTLGLKAALEWLGDEMERLYGLTVDIDSEYELPVLPEPIRTTVFRAVRELLINVAKHARTGVAQINCQQTADDRVSISVTDEGQGFDYQLALSTPIGDSGFGLMSIRERIEFIGGEMNVDSTPGYGTTVTIAFPASGL